MLMRSIFLLREEFSHFSEIKKNYSQGYCVIEELIAIGWLVIHFLQCFLFNDHPPQEPYVVVNISVEVVSPLVVGNKVIYQRKPSCCCYCRCCCWLRIYNWINCWCGCIRRCAWKRVSAPTYASVPVTRNFKVGSSRNYAPCDSIISIRRTGRHIAAAASLNSSNLVQVYASICCSPVIRWASEEYDGVV